MIWPILKIFPLDYVINLDNFNNIPANQHTTVRGWEPREGVIVKCPQNGHFHDPDDMILMSRMAVRQDCRSRIRMAVSGSEMSKKFRYMSPITYMKLKTLVVVIFTISNVFYDFQELLFLEQKCANQNCSSTQTCKFFLKWFWFFNLRGLKLKILEKWF